MLDILDQNAQMILVAGIVVFVFIFFLALIAWNRKTNKQVRTLVSIDGSLKNIEKDAVKPQPEPEEKTPNLEKPAEPEPPVALEPAPVEEQVAGRSGRIYTRSELEKQIRE